MYWFGSPKIESSGKFVVIGCYSGFDWFTLVSFVALFKVMFCGVLLLFVVLDVLFVTFAVVGGRGGGGGTYFKVMSN